MLHEIMYAPDRQSAKEDIERFAQEFQAKYPKAVECLLKDQDKLSTVKARTKRTKGAGSRKAGLAMAFKLLLGAEKHWRKINTPPHLVALVQAGVEFADGQRQLSLMAA